MPNPSPQPTDRALLSTEMRLAGVPGDDRAMDVIASTDALDAHGTVLDQASWKLDRFRANPVVLYAHNQRDLPVGFAENVRVEDGALRARLRFVTAAANPLAEQVWQLVQQKALRAVSVGFFAGDMKTQKRGGREIAVLTDNELLEISVVPVPSNPEAVAKMRARALSQHEEPMSDAKKSQAVEPDEDPIKNAPPQSAAAEHAPVLPSDALAIKCQTAEAEVARMAAKCEGLEARIATLQAELTALRAEDAAKEIAARDAEIATLQAQLVAHERRALIADARAAGKLSPAHLDPTTPKGEFLASLSVHQLRAYLESKGREIPLSEARPPRPIRAKDWSEMEPNEKARLYQIDRATYDALKAAAGE